jgi:DNA-binding MarR family transcriptional regulator
LATECYANLIRTGDLLLGEHSRRLHADFGISPTAGMVLAIVEGSGGPLSPTVIAERLIVTTASVTSLLDTLEKRGMVRRRPHPDDRRRVLVELTPQGQAVLDRLLPGMHRFERRMFDGLAEEDKRRLLGLLGWVQARAAELAREAAEPMGGRRNRPGRLGRASRHAEEVLDRVDGEVDDEQGGDDPKDPVDLAGLPLEGLDDGV